MTADDPTIELGPDDLAVLARFSDVLADESTWLEAPASLVPAVSKAIARERDQLVAATPSSVQRLPQRRSLAPWLTVAAAAVAALALGALLGRATGGTSPDREVAAVATELEPDVDGSVGVRSISSGVELRLDVDGVPRRDNGEFYQGWLKSCDGQQLVPIGTFHELTDVTAWAGVSTDDLPILTVTREAVAPPKDAAQGSSGEVVLTAQVGPACP